MAEVKVTVQLVSVETITFGDGTKRPKANVKLDSGAVADVWGTNDSSDALIGLASTPMGTPLDLTFDLRVKNGKLAVHLLDAVVKAASGRAA